MYRSPSRTWRYSIPVCRDIARARRATLLVFTRGAEEESRHRRLLPASLRGEELALRHACLRATLDAGREAGCRILVSSSRPLGGVPEADWVPQMGDGFGERLRRALADAFARTGGPVLAVGSDAPGLTADHLRRACAVLAANPEAVVLGPATDGGVYLLAAARPFDGSLAAVRWCEPGTRASLRHALTSEGRPVVLLDPLADLDRPADLERWLAAGAHASLPLRDLAGRLGRLLALNRRPLAANRRPPLDPPAVRLLPGRAPPLSASH